MTSRQPTISVVVATHNRATSLTRCLSALARINFAPHDWELIVVNNASTDNTGDVVTQFASSVPFKVHLVEEPVAGVSGARNRGARQARAAIVAFTDDDCYVERDFLKEIVRAFDENPDCGYIGGRVLLHDPTDAEETIKLDEQPADIPPYSCVTPGVMHGANLAVRRNVWEQVGGFDRMLGPGTRFCADDIDFMGRISALGWKGRYIPGPAVRHHHGRKPGADVQQLRRAYAKGRGAYYAKGVLNARVRRAYLQAWYWHLRRLLKRGEYATASRELAAGVSFLTQRLYSGPLPMFADAPQAVE